MTSAQQALTWDSDIVPSVLLPRSGSASFYRTIHVRTRSADNRAMNATYNLAGPAVRSASRRVAGLVVRHWVEGS